MTLKENIDALQQAAYSVEHDLREGGYYDVADCASFDALVRRGNRRGVALLFDEDGNLDEVVSLNDGGKHVEVSSEGNTVHVEHSFPMWEKPQREEKRRDETRKIVEEAGESYEAMGGETFQKAAARSHAPGAKTARRCEPQSHATGDAARIARELKATQDRNTAIAKRQYQEGVSRTETIAQQMKEASNKQWAGRQ